jgi:multiple sugar transport system substrate-binding protein
VFTNFRSNVTAVMHQFGARFFDRDYTHCTLDSPEAVAALAFCADLIHRYELVPLPENIDAWIGFRQGKVGMVFEGVYMLADLRRQQDLDFGGAPVPLLGREPATWCDSHVLCVRRGTNPEHLEAAQRLITFLSENSLDWAEGGQVPVRRDLRETIRFQEMPVQAAFAQQIPYSKYPPRVPFVFEFYSEFDLAIERVLRGSAEPEQALTAAAAKINEAMARDRRNNPRTRAAQPEPPSTTDRGGTP